VREPVTSDPRILFVDQTGKLGGAEFCLADLAIHLRNRCTVFLFEPGPFQELLQRSGVDVAIAEERLGGIIRRRGGSLARGPSSRRGLCQLNVRKRSGIGAYLLALPVLKKGTKRRKRVRR